MDQEQLAEVVKEIEEEKALGRVSAVAVFKSVLNQPELVNISSANAVPTGASYAYTGFTANLPRPALDVETLQLLAANIPLCTQNIPDTACAFWYYRLDDYANTTPNPNCLFYVKLLPSYYKPEFISTGYGINTTFNTYNDLATQLALSCTRDLTYDNLRYAITFTELNALAFELNYIPSDISITYNSTQNKFQMTGQNASAPLFAYSAADTYASGTTYAVGAYVTSNKIVYRSLLAANIGNTPATSPLYWAFRYGQTRSRFRSLYALLHRSICRQSKYGIIYQAITNIWTGSFSIGSGWRAPVQATGPYYYRYLITGYNDPNVLAVQGTGYKQWNPYALYEGVDIVRYEGVDYTATRQNKGFVPFSIPSTTINAYSAGTTYAVGDYVYYSTRWYVCIKITTGNAPTGAIHE
jgi:hypothetical protein